MARPFLVEKYSPRKNALSPPMQLLSLTLETPAENLALDEALLDAAEAGELAEPVLRLWEPAEHFVVLGRSSVARREVFLEACRSDGVPVYRRSSGGGTILAGPGCLMYAVVLGYEAAPHLRAIDVAHRTVLGTIASALPMPDGKVAQAGISDLVFPSLNPDSKGVLPAMPCDANGTICCIMARCFTIFV